MKPDFLDPRNSEGMPQMADGMFALDFLMSAKNGVRNCAIALTECVTPEARTIVRNLLEEGLELHQEISLLMISKGWLHPFNVKDQFLLDIKSAETTVQLASMQLFPDHTSRLGNFATPQK
jgi:similar to spore coat protein